SPSTRPISSRPFREEMTTANRPVDELTQLANAALDQLAEDESIHGSLDVRGYVPLLEWAGERAYAVAQSLDPMTDVEKSAAMVYSLLSRLVRAAVWAAEAGDVAGLVSELDSCPRSVVDRRLASAALSRLALGDEPDPNAEAIAAALRAATP